MPTVLRVAVPVPLPQLFDYRLPPGSDAESVAPGCRVLVPFGRAHRVGIVIAIADHSELAPAQLKAATSLLDRQSLLPPELLATLQWGARYYQCPLGLALETALPVGLRSARPLPAPGEPALQRQPIASPRLRTGTRSAALLELLSEGPQTFRTLDERLPEWRSAAAHLRRRGLIASVTLDLRQPPHALIAAPPLTAEQQAASSAIAAHLGQFAPIVLEGITGSGKTEVYLALMAQVAARGEQTLVLVPEIGLTPQALRRFRERLPCTVAALHSGLSDGERTRVWLAAARGEIAVILGTRSAVFTPLAKAGLIVIDEEHDGSYKQQDGWRYSARDLALMRGKLLGVPVVLGSATPSLETMANVESGRFRRFALSARPGAARPPTFRCIDLRGKQLTHGLTAELVIALRACLERGEQALVFRNRRGYAPVLLCHGCGWHASCERCDKPLTLHRAQARLRCHHCGAAQRIPAHCPQCGKLELAPQGAGTERIGAALSELFPGSPVVRIDRETTRGKNAFDALLTRLQPDQPGLLVGTQMLAKGHDLPNLTLVAILGVDQGLYSVDFRAGERLAQLVTQVAGRAGRALKPGVVYLQTHHPDHPLLRVLLRDGYAAAARALLDERRHTELPPYAHLALLRAEAKIQTRVDEFLTAALAIASAPDGLNMLGPLPAPMPLRAGMHRGQVLVSATDRSSLQAFLPHWLTRVRNLPTARRVRWSIDIDPLDLY